MLGSLSDTKAVVKVAAVGTVVVKGVDKAAMEVASKAKQICSKKKLKNAHPCFAWRSTTSSTVRQNCQCGPKMSFLMSARMLHIFQNGHAMVVHRFGMDGIAKCAI